MDRWIAPLLSFVIGVAGTIFGAGILYNQMTTELKSRISQLDQATADIAGLKKRTATISVNDENETIFKQGAFVFRLEGDGNYGVFRNGLPCWLSDAPLKRTC